MINSLTSRVLKYKAPLTYFPILQQLLAVLCTFIVPPVYMNACRYTDNSLLECTYMHACWLVFYNVDIAYFERERLD